MGKCLFIEHQFRYICMYIHTKVSNKHSIKFPETQGYFCLKTWIKQTKLQSEWSEGNGKIGVNLFADLCILLTFSNMMKGYLRCFAIISFLFRSILFSFSNVLEGEKEFLLLWNWIHVEEKYSNSYKTLEIHMKNNCE